MDNELFVVEGKKRRSAALVVCAHCNKEFLKRKDHALTATSHYCSLLCFNLEQKGELANATERTCTKCKATKPLSEFYDRKRGGKRSTCIPCFKGQTTFRTLTWKKRYPAESSASAYKACIMMKYGITQEEYDRRNEEQGGLCALCRNPESRTYKGAPVRLSVDHCHKTGIVRGLLCSKCNTAIGLLNEKLELFEQAVAYLKRNYEEGKETVV